MPEVNINRLETLTALIKGNELLGRIADLAGPGRVFLVGGIVRDCLAGRRISLRSDVDLAVKSGVFSLCRKPARETGARMVILSQEERTARLILPGLQVDLAGFRRNSLEGDLRARDFSINALALDLHQAAQGKIELIDPCRGLRDLETGVLRAAGPDSLAQDPLRILRAYRFGAQLDLTPAASLRRSIRDLAGELARVAGERINAELTRLLPTPQSAPWLEMMHQDGVLGVVFPEVAALEGLAQNRFHHLDGLAHTLEAVRQAEIVLSRGGPVWVEALAGEGDRVLKVKLALLYHDTGKKDTLAQKPDGGLSFRGHDKLSGRLWAGAAKRLRFSRETAKAVELLIRAHMRPLSLLSAPEITLRARRRLVLAAGAYLDELGLLCLADSLATRGPEKDPRAEERLTRLWEKLRATRAALESQAREPLVTGHDLIRELNLRPGPLIGRLLSGLEEARLGGEVRDRREALAWARRELEKESDHPSP